MDLPPKKGAPGNEGLFFLSSPIRFADPVPWHSQTPKDGPLYCQPKLDTDNRNRAGASLKWASALAPCHLVTKQQAGRAGLQTFMVPTKNSEKTPREGRFIDDWNRRASNVPAPYSIPKLPLHLPFHLTFPPHRFLWPSQQSLGIFPPTNPIRLLRHFCMDYSLHVSKLSLVTVQIHKKEQNVKPIEEMTLKEGKTKQKQLQQKNPNF